MANTEKIAGIDSYLIYGAESTYGTAATPTLSFGALVQDVNPSMKNNIKKFRGFTDGSNNGRDVSHVIGGTFEVSFSANIIPLSWGWLEYVLGAVSGAGTVASPYAYVAANLPVGLTVSSNINNDTTDRESKYLGCVINQVVLKAAVGEAVTASIDFLAGDMAKDSTIASNVALPSLEPFSFVGGTIEIPNASAISNIIDSVEITITNSAEIKYGFSRTTAARNFKARDYSLKFTVKYLDETLVEKFLGASGAPIATTPAADATVAIRFQNAANHYVDFIFSNGYIEDFAEGHTLNEMITEDITYTAKSLAVNEVIQS
jgi:hypothetical protein